MTRYLLVGLVVCALTACPDNQEPGPQVGGDSHFLTGCSSDADCGDHLSCICSTCTHSCDDDDACQVFDPAMHCASDQDEGMEAMCGVLDTPVTLCVVTCGNDADCADVVDGGECFHGLCVVP